MCSSFKRLGRKIRFMIFPMSKVIEERTQKIEQDLKELRSVKQSTSAEVSKVTQPDVLRSLVISMNRSVGKRK